MTQNEGSSGLAAASPDWGVVDNLQPDRFIAQARAETGLDVLGDDSFREGLDLVCAGLRSDMMVRSGRWILGGNIVTYLSNRLQVEEWHRRHPHLAEVPIEAPIVILGLPRTGTTALSYLLDQDPQWRSLLNWEATNSAPPATIDTRRTDQRCLDTLEFQRAVLPQLDPAPPHWEWADGPTECTFLLAQDFKAALWQSRVPTAAYRDFLSATDMGSAYRWHRRVLQVLQNGTPERWVLKMPAHAFFIDALLDEYPDARIIWTHRDPATAVSSFMNLTAFAHGLSLGAPDLDWIRENVPPRLLAQAQRPMERLAGRDVFHWHYASYQRDQLGQVGDLYDWLGASLTEGTRTAMSTWLTKDPLVASRQSSYAAEDFGLQRADLHAMFEDYTAAFGVQLDPPRAAQG